MKTPGSGDFRPHRSISAQDKRYATVATSAIGPASSGCRWGIAGAVLLAMAVLAAPLVQATTLDTSPPVFVNAEVPRGGDIIIISYNEDLDHTRSNFPPTEAFTLLVDGVTSIVGDLSRPALGFSSMSILIIPRNRIYQGQTVTLSYADPTSANDAQALQDLAGNDAPSFNDQIVINNSTRVPATVALSAFAEGPSSIWLEWGIVEGVDYSDVSSYVVEYSDDGLLSWNEITDYTGDRTNLQYTMHRGLSPGTLYYYRVSVKVRDLTHPPSEVGSALTESQPPVIGGLSYTPVTSGSRNAGANLCWTPDGVPLSQLSDLQYGYMYFEFDENSAMPWEDDGTFHFVDLRGTESCNGGAGLGFYRRYLSGQKYFVKLRALRSGQSVESNRLEVRVLHPNTTLKARIRAEGFYGIGPDGRPVFRDVPKTVDKAFEIAVGFGYQFPGDAATTEVTGFEIADLEVTNATLTAPTGGLTYEPFIGYRVVVTPTTLGHDVTVKVKANAVTGKGTTRQNLASGVFRRRTAP